MAVFEDVPGLRYEDSSIKRMCIVCGDLVFSLLVVVEISSTFHSESLRHQGSA